MNKTLPSQFSFILPYKLRETQDAKYRKTVCIVQYAKFFKKVNKKARIEKDDDCGGAKAKGGGGGGGRVAAIAPPNLLRCRVKRPSSA